MTGQCRGTVGIAVYDHLASLFRKESEKTVVRIGGGAIASGNSSGIDLHKGNMLDGFFQCFRGDAVIGFVGVIIDAEFID